MQQLELPAIEVIPFTQSHAVYVVNFIPQTQRYGLLLGDKSCLDLAKDRKLAVLTADTVLSQLVGIEVILIR